MFDRAAIWQLAKSLVLICGTHHPTTVVLRIAAESSIDKKIKTARLLFLLLSPGDRRAALALLGD